MGDRIFDKDIELVILDEKEHSQNLNIRGCLQIIYVVSGNFKINLDNNVLDVYEDEMVLVGPYSTCECLEGLDSKRICVAIPEAFLLDSKVVFVLSVSKILRNKQANRYFLNIIREHKKFVDKGISNVMAAKGLCFTIWGMLDGFYKIFENVDNHAPLSMLETVVKYINENYRNQISLDELVKQTGYNKFYISKEFNKNFKMSLSDYVNKIRLLAFVVDMKENPKSNIIATALDCGFKSTANFYVVFKKKYGVSPSELFKQ